MQATNVQHVSSAGDREKSSHALRSEWVAAIALAIALVLLRALVFVLWEQSHFDADQAIVGLMAKHILEGRAFPLYFYGQQYLLGVEALLVVPAFLVGGVSVPALKWPLVLLNAGIAAGLIVALARWAGLRPWHGLAASLFFTFAPPGTASRLVQANGCNIEPFAYVLALWWLRARPLWLGLVIGIGVLHREFTAYGVSALLAVELAHGRVWRDGLRKWAVTAIVALAVWHAVQALVPYASAQGPGTSYADLQATSHAGEIAGRFCWNEGQVFDRLRALITAQLPEMFGARRQPVVRIGIIAEAWQGVDGAWPVLAAIAAGVALRILWLVARGAPRHALPVCTYLGLVGLQAVLMYAVMCGQRSHLTMRYMLLGLLAPVALWACHLAVERSSAWKAATLVTVALWAAVSGLAHAGLWREYLTSPPPADYRTLTDHLLQRGVRNAQAPFWDAYHVTFLSGERVRVASSDLVRIKEYGWQFELNRRESVTLRTRPCGGQAGTRVARWWVCPAGTE